MAAAMSPFEMPSSFATGFLPWYLCGMKPTSAYDTTERQNRQKLMPTRDEFFVSIGGLGGTKIKCVDPRNTDHRVSVTDFCWITVKNYIET
jgi:hypothetical protein